MSQMGAYLRVKKTESSEQDSKKRPPTIEITNSYNKISQDADAHGVSIRKRANDLIDMYYEKQEQLSQILPDLKMIAFKDGIMYIFDSKQSKTARVGLKNNNAFCDVCNSKECIHVTFGLAQLEFSRLEHLPKN